MVLTKPGEELEWIWTWNMTRDRRYSELQEDIFIPRIMFMTVDGVLGSTVVWPDGISTLIPDVDFLYVPRKKLAPKRFLRKREEDFCVVGRKDRPEFFDYYLTDDIDGRACKLSTPETPKVVKDYVRGLIKFEGKIEGVAFDSVLNAELVAQAGSAGR